MPNKKGGKKFKKGKKGNDSFVRELILKDPKELEDYGRITRGLGNCRFEVFTLDGKTRIGIVKGKMRKKVWVNKDDIVLIGLWDFQDDKCSIIHKYAEDEVGKLIGKNEIPIGFKVSSEEDFNEEENYFDYAQSPNSSSEEEEEDEEDEEDTDEESKKSKSSSSSEEEIDLDDI
jgi:translation initiation factor 1A